MKVVCVADAYITAQMMEEGVRPALGPDDSLEIFFFGLPGREQMRDMVRTLEKGGRDSISLHARSSKPIITDAEFALMKRGAVLINTARAVLIDSSALKRALDGGILLGAALDVFDTEPDIPAYLREYDNVTLSSHRAGDTINSYKDAPAFAIGNFLGWLEGKPLKFKV